MYLYFILYAKEKTLYQQKISNMMQKYFVINIIERKNKEKELSLYTHYIYT